MYRCCHLLLLYETPNLKQLWNRSVPDIEKSPSHIPQAYIPKRRTRIQVLPPANAYTKSANAYCLRIAISHSIRIFLVYALSA